jgi:hypothetical protein
MNLRQQRTAEAPEERGAYLERECAGDSGLRDRVLALLKAHDRAGHVIDRPVNGDPDQTAGYAPTREQPGTVIAGRYKLLGEIGQGGMGTVWATEQTSPVRRKVALKLIKAGMDSRSVLARDVERRRRTLYSLVRERHSGVQLRSQQFHLGLLPDARRLGPRERSSRLGRRLERGVRVAESGFGEGKE